MRTTAQRTFSPEHAVNGARIAMDRLEAVVA